MSNKSSTSRVGNPTPLDLEHDRVMLSNRESEVVRRTRNKSYATIADELDISESTVGTYRHRATTKLSEQVKVIRRMLRQQQADQREENIQEIAREAVECLRDCGIDVEFHIESEENTGESSEEITAN